MTAYLIKRGDNFFVQQTAGFLPAGAIAVVPEEYDKSDWPYLTAVFENDNWVISIDSGLKTVAYNTELAKQTAKAWDDLRVSRNQKLSDTDFTQLADAPISAELKADYAVYRQQLRDLPDNTVNPLTPTWPPKPVG